MLKVKPVKTEHTNSILKGYDNVEDLPITRLKYDNCNCVESCWQVNEEELKKINETGKVYFVCLGDTHPPISLRANSLAES